MSLRERSPQGGEAGDWWRRCVCCSQGPEPDQRTERHKCEVQLEWEGDHCILCDWRKERRVAVRVGSWIHKKVQSWRKSGPGPQFPRQAIYWEGVRWEWNTEEAWGIILKLLEDRIRTWLKTGNRVIDGWSWGINRVQKIVICRVINIHYYIMVSGRSNLLQSRREGLFQKVYFSDKNKE